MWPARPMRCRPRGHGLRRLDLQHEVDGAHVDAQLQRRRGDEAGQLARLEHLLDDGALLARQRAVVGPGDRRRLRAQLVQPQREALGAAPVVDEDDRRAVLAHEVEQLAGRSPARSSGASPRLRHRLSGSSSAPGSPRARPSTRPAPGSAGRAACARRRRRSVHVAPRADHEAADLLERVLRRAQADALDVVRPAPASSRSSVSARCGAALRRRDRVDLVDDHRTARRSASRAPAR